MNTSSRICVENSVVFREIVRIFICSCLIDKIPIASQNSLRKNPTWKVLPEKWRVWVESYLRGFYHSPHRGVDAGQHGCRTTEYKSTNSPLPPLLNVMYRTAWEFLWGRSKYFLRNTKEKGVVGNQGCGSGPEFNRIRIRIQSDQWIRIRIESHQ